MWNESSVQGGGYFNTPNQFGSTNTPDTKAKKGGKRSSRITPLTIGQILRSSEDGVKLYGMEVQIASVMARVKHIKVESTKIVYTIQDITGVMKAIMWLDQDAMAEGDKVVQPVSTNVYLQLFGNVKMNLSKKVLMLFKILDVTNSNAITFHYLQCIHNKAKLESMEKAKMNGNMNASTSSMMPANSMMNMEMGGAAAAGFNPRQLMVFNLIRGAQLDTGINRSDMQQSLNSKMTKSELDKVLEWMCSEGHIYSTIDEDHFRATDAS